MSLVNFIRKIKNPYNYNIGFIKITPKELITNKKLGEIRWLEHDYKDRFFADPFILEATDNKIIVLVEELIFGKQGTIVELTIDAKTTKLLERNSLLELETHLSYPFIFQLNGKTYVMPENSQAGQINVYEYENHKLTRVNVVINEGINDATFIKKGQNYYMLATKIYPDCNKDVYLYHTDNPLEKWTQLEKSPVVTSKHYSRPGGAFFEYDGKMYRVAQDCDDLYGNSIHIREVKSFLPYEETEYCHIKPKSYRYSKGLHTLNFNKTGIAVVDGNGYFYPTLGRIFSPIFKLYYRLTK